MAGSLCLLLLIGEIEDQFVNKSEMNSSTLASILQNTVVSILYGTGVENFRNDVMARKNVFSESFWKYVFVGVLNYVG